jgi:O-antigen/teichoic acid export membrane protein
MTDPAGSIVVQEDDSAAGGELRQLARGGSLSLAGVTANALLGFLFVGLLSHVLPVETAGALFEAIAVFTICAAATQLGADAGMLRLAALYRRRRPNDLRRLTVIAFVPSFVGSAVAGLLVFFFAPQLTHIFVHHAPHADTPTDLRILAAFLAASTTTTVLTTGMRAWSFTPFVAINSFFVPLARIVLLGVVYAIGITPRLAAVAWATPLGAGFVAAIVLTEFYLRKEGRHTALSESLESSGAPASYRAIARSFWAFSLPRSIGGIFQILIIWLDVLLVGAFKSAKDAAAYTVASRYLIVGTFALLAVGFAMAPAIVRLMDSGDRARARNLYQVSTYWVLAASWPVLVTLLIFAPFFMSLFGHRYQMADSALMILAAATLANTGTGCNGVVLLMSGRSWVNLWIAGLGLGINVGVDVVLIPRLGLVGAAIGWTATIFVTAVVASGLLWKLYRISPFGSGYIPMAAATLACFGVPGLIARLAFGTRPLTFVAYAVVSSALYAGALYHWRRTFHLHAFTSMILRRSSPPQSGTVGVAGGGEASG